MTDHEGHVLKFEEQSDRKLSREEQKRERQAS
jgi:hypothetical protein